ncbi:hypothetical protein ACIBPB_30450 [Micromonospora sp. NPDC049836]|uniref:zinc finger domain-containing protein n=1 Tax=Micromonospora sp. NPDC049836 TaxID=3364274 RepID=UPI00379DAA2A
MFEKGELTSHSVGVTYLVELPNGNVKIGYSRDHETLAIRLTSLSSQFSGKVHLLATVAAGETYEAVLHARFSDYRHWNAPLEQFYGVDELYDYAEEIGLEANGILAKKAFEGDIYPRFLATPNAELPTWVSCPTCSASKGAECTWRVRATGRFHKNRVRSCKSLFPSYQTD